MRLGATEAAGSIGLGPARRRVSRLRQPDALLHVQQVRPGRDGAEFKRGRAVGLYTLWVPTGWRTDRGIRLGGSAVERERGVRHAAALRVRALLRRWSSGEGRSRARSTSSAICSGPSPCSARQCPRAARPPEDLDNGLLGARDVLVAVRQQLEHPAGEQLLDRAVEDDARQARIEVGAQLSGLLPARTMRSIAANASRTSLTRGRAASFASTRARARAPGRGPAATSGAGSRRRDAAAPAPGRRTPRRRARPRAGPPTSR